MKELLLSGCFLLFLSSVWAQQQKLNLSWSPSAMNMQQYWDSVKKKIKPNLKNPHTPSGINKPVQYKNNRI